MAILEALAHGKPVLISPRCHFPDVERFGAGRIVPTDDDSLSTALADLLSSRERLVSMGEAGRKLVTRSYTWDAAAALMVDTYEEGIERHRNAMARGSHAVS